MFFQKRLIEWYLQNKRELPWRNTTDPYMIWLSEIILQQTRVAQGLPYFRRFIDTFPTIYDLAQAYETDILRLWQGLGYYSRARNLHACAIDIVNRLDGKFPESYHELIKLKGIGKYTAAAIASFAFHQPVAVVDGNVYRVLSRLLGMYDDISTSSGQRAFFDKAQELIDKNDPDLYNQAMMEFGALQCTPKAPDCENCILKDSCFAYGKNEWENLPVKTKKVKVRTRYFNYLILRMGDKVWMNQRKSGDIWQGLYDFYLIESDNSLKPEDIMDIHHLLQPEQIQMTLEMSSSPYIHQLTHQKIIATFHTLTLPENMVVKNMKNGNFESFFDLAEVKDLPKPILIDNYLNEHIF